MNNEKYKLLEAKLGYEQLEELCDRKGWSIPTYEEVEKEQLDTYGAFVWVHGKRLVDGALEGRIVRENEGTYTDTLRAHVNHMHRCIVRVN